MNEPRLKGLALAAAHLQARMRRRGGARRPSLLLLTDSIRLPDPAGATATLPYGTGARGKTLFNAGVVIRERDEAKRRALAFALTPLCRRRRVALLVANDARLARAVGAAGVHLSEEIARHGLLSPLALARKGSRLRSRAILSIAAHSAGALARAIALGADIVLLSPAFATPSHPDAKPIGPIRFALMARAARRRHADLSVFALGGVSDANAQRLMRAGADGFAAIGALA